MILCSVPECGREINCRGFCQKHYYRFMKHGDPNVIKYRDDCIISECSNEHIANGYCNNHYRLWVRYGRPADFDGRVSIKEIKLHTIFNEFFKDDSIKDKCWDWQGCVNDWGYGTATYKGKKSRLVHRASYEYFIEKIPEGLLCCHHCDRPICFNPNHLFLGTNQDNVDDMIKKGRHRNSKTGKIK